MNTRQLAALAALVTSTTLLTACQDVAPPSPGERPSTSPSTSSSNPAAGDVGPDGADAQRRESLTNDGGYVVQGSKITFVYRNGMRYVLDMGQPIPAGDTTLKTAAGSLAIKGSTATLTQPKGVTTVNHQGAGAVVDETGAIVVAPDGSTTCGNSQGLQFVGSDGSKGAANLNGLFYTDKAGKSVTSGRTPEVTSLAGRYTMCNVGGTASVDLYSDVLFEFDKAQLTPAGKAVAASAARSIKTSVDGKAVKVVGHTDSKGAADYNMGLGKRRADAVAAELRRTLPGVKVSVSSAGETAPVAANLTTDGKDNPDGRAKNRRVTISWEK